MVEDLTLMENKVYTALCKQMPDTDKSDLIKPAAKSVGLYHKFELEMYLQIRKKGITGCSGCGVCCEKCNIVMTQNDVFRLGREIDVTGHIKTDPERVGRYNFKETPCSLHDPRTGRCTAYAHRPESCRNYPFIAPHNENRCSRDPECDYAIQFLAYKAAQLFWNENKER